MNLKINNRLLKISDFIYEKDKVIDIGCDHGLLGIYLVLNKNITKMVSSDINEMPLSRARDNIKKYNLENKIETKLGNGIETVSDDINTIVISGMGGLTINQILENINKYSNITKIIVSPNNEFVATRKFISKCGFYLNKEIMVYENGKYYLISSYIRGKKRKSNYFFGNLNLNDNVVQNYYKLIVQKNTIILNNLNGRHFIKKISLLHKNYIIRRKISKSQNINL